MRGVSYHNIYRDIYGVKLRIVVVILRDVGRGAVAVPERGPVVRRDGSEWLVEVKRGQADEGCLAELAVHAPAVEPVVGEAVLGPSGLPPAVVRRAVDASAAFHLVGGYPVAPGLLPAADRVVREGWRLEHPSVDDGERGFAAVAVGRAAAVEPRGEFRPDLEAAGGG